MCLLTAVGLSKQVSSYNETYRPQYHYTHNENVLIGPAGLYRALDGKFNVFYLYSEQAKQPKENLALNEVNQGTNIGWGHAMSMDLVHWQEKELLF